MSPVPFDVSSSIFAFEQAKVEPLNATRSHAAKWGLAHAMIGVTGTPRR